MHGSSGAGSRLDPGVAAGRGRGQAEPRTSPSVGGRRRPVAGRVDARVDRRRVVLDGRARPTRSSPPSRRAEHVAPLLHVLGLQRPQAVDQAVEEVRTGLTYHRPSTSVTVIANGWSEAETEHRRTPPKSDVARVRLSDDCSSGSPAQHVLVVDLGPVSSGVDERRGSTSPVSGSHDPKSGRSM